MTALRDGTRLAAGALLRGAAVAGPHLVVADGPDAGRAIPLHADQTIGRGRGADLWLGDPAASRLHARLLREGDGYVAEDLGSKNGMRVNGRRCRRRPLRAGDEISIGATRLILTRGLLDERAGNAPGPSSPPPPAPRQRSLRSATVPLAAAAAMAALASLLLALP